MSDCRETKGLLGCFKPDDGSEPETLAVHYVYDSNGAIFATYYYDAEDNVIDKDTYRGGGSVTLGECVIDELYTPNAIESVGIATVTIPVSPVRAFSITREGGQVRFSTDGGITWVNMNRNGSRSFGNNGRNTLIDTSNVIVEGLNAGANFDVIWEI